MLAISTALLVLTTSALAAPMFHGHEPAVLTGQENGCLPVSKISEELSNEPWNIVDLVFFSLSGSVCAYTGDQFGQPVLVKAELLVGFPIPDADEEAVRAPQELEFWKAYIGVNGAGHGTATLAGGIEQEDCEAMLEGMHQTILGTVRLQVRNIGWLNWGITAQNVLWDWNRSVHRIQFIAWDKAENVGRRELTPAEVARARNLAQNSYSIAQICQPPQALRVGGAGM